MTEILLQDGQYQVTTSTVCTSRRTVRLNKIEQTRLSRPLLFPALGLCVAAGGFVAAFDALLYPHEVFVLIAAPLLLLPVVWCIGVLKLEHHGMGGSDVLFGSYRRLTRIRAAIDIALETGGVDR